MDPQHWFKERKIRIGVIYKSRFCRNLIWLTCRNAVPVYYSTSCWPRSCCPAWTTSPAWTCSSWTTGWACFTTTSGTCTPSTPFSHAAVNKRGRHKLLMFCFDYKENSVIHRTLHISFNTLFTIFCSKILNIWYLWKFFIYKSYGANCI